MVSGKVCPAELIKVLDERGKDYCARGDEVVCARITELVRGPLAFAFHQILSHGLRSSRHAGIWPSNASSSSTHPWTFIEALSRSVIPTANGGADADGTFRKRRAAAAAESAAATPN
uniref:RUN domain-containing protein n=1 Tax=Globodera pallida TaxID=36090 RepID=A0A183CSV1_GLOPA